MAAVNFCRPPGSSETLCHNVSCIQEPPLLPPLFSCSNYTCGPPTMVPPASVPPTMDNMTTMSMTFVTTMTSSTTPTPDPSCDLICIVIIIIIIIILLLLAILAILLGVLYFRKKGPFKVLNRHHSKEFDRPHSAKQTLSEEQQNEQHVELRSIPLTWDTQDDDSNATV